MTSLKTESETLKVDDILFKVLPCEDAESETGEITFTLPSASDITSKVGVGKTFRFEIVNSKTLRNVVLAPGTGVTFSPASLEVDQESRMSFTGYVISKTKVLIM